MVAMQTLIVQFVFSFVIALLLGYPAGMLATYFGIMDIPGSAPHKKHARPTPLAGGILIAIVLLVLIFFYRTSLNLDILIVFVGALIICSFGLWDDIKGLPVVIKVIGQLIASGILIFFGVQVHFMTDLFENSRIISPNIAQLLNIIITLFWLIGITNAMNMIDSMNGIVAGLGIIASALFMSAADLANQSILTLWSARLLGICAGLFFWNRLVVVFFLGDSGSQTLGFLLASFGILYNPLYQNPESSWIVPILMLGVPIFDTTLVVFSRLRRRQPIGVGRRDHTYHRFIKLGMLPGYAVLSVHIMALVMSGLAFFTFYLKPSTALLFFLGAIFGGLAFLLWLERQPALDDEPTE